MLWLARIMLRPNMYHGRYFVVYFFTTTLGITDGYLPWNALRTWERRVGEHCLTG
jgi:hypothetical protein